MSERNQEQAEMEQKPQMFDRMPGADPIEDSGEGQLDLNFGLGEEPNPVEEPEEAVIAEEPAEEEAEEQTADNEEEEEEGEEAEVDSEEPEIAADVEEEVAPLAAKDKKSPMVPKSRLDEVLAKQKALQKQLEDLRAAQETPPEAPEEYDFDAKEVEYQQLVLDGESAKAVALRKEIRAAEKAQIQWEMDQKMGQTVQQSQQATALQQAAAEVEAAYPVFDRNSSDFNEEYTNEVVELRDAFIVKGYDAVDALSRAVKYVVKDRGLDDDVEAPALAQAQTEISQKKKANVAKKLKAAESQPPELEGEGSSARGEKLLDLQSMSEDEFSALPEATLRRLRGDII